MKIYHVNAFTDSDTGGNPAGVVLNADQLTEKDMLRIAYDVGYSETAFISSSDVADFRIRFFTPSDEVDLCGHATIASFTVLNALNLIQEGKYSQETKAGVLDVLVSKTGEIFMNQLLPSSYEVLDKKLIADSLGIHSEDIMTAPQVYSTGLKDIIVHLKDLQTIENLKPNFELITEISQRYESTGYHVFTLETLENKTAHCRNFAPLYAIDEEAATGTASGAVSGYIIEKQLIEVHEGLNVLEFEQGFEMNRPSWITSKIKIENNKIIEVVIGGKGKIQQS